MSKKLSKYCVALSLFLSLSTSLTCWERGGRENIDIQEGPRNQGGYRSRENVQADESQSMESPEQENRMYQEQSESGLGMWDQEP